MVHDLSVRGDYDPLYAVLIYHILDHLVCLVAQARVYNSNTSGDALLLLMAPCFPAVKYDSDVMSFQFFVCNKLTDNRLPLFLQIPVLSADEIVPVNNNRRNCPASGEFMRLL